MDQKRQEEDSKEESRQDESKMTGTSCLGGICCLALSTLLGNPKVAVPGSTAYNGSLASYFSNQQAEIHPACVVSPQTVHDVSAAVVSLTTTAEGRCGFAIRSGGHTSWAGASSIAEGVTIDLRSLNDIDVSADRKTVSIGAGASWDAVYAKLDPLGLCVAGGRAAGVGVGGLVLGGGISYHSPRFGWTTDTVSNFQVVLADGSIVNANAKENADLFVALRGGSNNFGIVTRVDLEAFDSSPIWASNVITLLSSADDQIAEFVKINSPTDYDKYASLITTFGYSQARNLSAISNQLEYTKAVANVTEGPAVYQGILNLPALVKTTQLTDMTNLSKATEALQPDGTRSLNLVTTLVSTVPMLKAAFLRWEATLPAIRNVSGIVWALALEPLPPAIYARHAKENSLGLADRKEALVVTLLTVTWPNAIDDVLINTTGAALIEAIEQDARKLSAYDPYVYLNYAGQFQDPIGSYGEASVRRLRKVRDRVDPKGVFTKQVPGGYKIPPGK
ncbi:putative oxidoreductase [Bombardia bombarda]|uniref:Oxidoreductase n=1 Tax=Bombardia bombarda TaxID=252184 RepID=A0AA39WIL4_9PEZI|nr:putative oxidoreductase [Bombardia bombarda]